jgi:hypothetical protein
MEKPISLKILDFKEKMAEEINKSELPICVIKTIMKEFYDEIVRQDIFQTQQDKENYEKGEK